MAISRLQALQDEMKKCFRCSLCKMIPLPVVRDPKYSDGCPAARMFHFHGYSGSGKSIMALSLVDGRIEADEALADIVFACTTCGMCDTACKFIMEAERMHINIALREHLVDEGLGPRIHQKIIEDISVCSSASSADNSFGDWARGLNLKILPEEKADVLLFAGCMQGRDQTSALAARKLAELMKAAGVDFGILGDDEPCCGLPAYWTGHRDTFEKTAEAVARKIDSLGVSTVVTTSGSCFGTLKSKYPEYLGVKGRDAGGTFGAEVIHATQLLARLVKDGSLRLSKPVKRRVTYHDPCYLGRQSEPPVQWKGEHRVSHGCMTYADPPRPVNRGVNGVFDEPRMLLQSIEGVALVEMHRIREYAFCCGGGGGVPEAYPELAEATAKHRLEEAAETGAEMLVTACHRCRVNLIASQRQAEQGEPAEKDHMPVVDIIDLVYEAAGL